MLVHNTSSRVSFEREEAAGGGQFKIVTHVNEFWHDDGTYGGRFGRCGTPHNGHNLKSSTFCTTDENQNISRETVILVLW